MQATGPGVQLDETFAPGPKVGYEPRALTFSHRSSFDSRPNALTLALIEHARVYGNTLLDLTVSNPTEAGIPYDTSSILSALADPRALVYEPHAFGLSSAREAAAREVSELAGLPVDAADVMLTASTSEAYSFLLKLLCDSGDEVLVPQPSYPLFEHLAAFEAVRLVPYPLAYDGAWHIDFAALRRAIGPRTRAVLVVNPNNPTGSFLKRDELAALAGLGLPIVSDEVFASYVLEDDPARTRSVLETSETLVFALGGLSKLAALPQMKVAWTVVGGPRAQRREALARLELIADTFLSVGTPVQHALPTLLATRASAHDAIAQRTRANLEALRTALARAASPATLLRTEGGWYATLRLPRTRSEEAWVLDCLEKDHVYVHPGAFFEFSEEAFLVLSLLTPEANFAEGVRRILDRVEERVEGRVSEPVR
ncbi:pyridoxal phosphate-dependent aminotransferase [Pendulispora albinea]|uniref:Pyridoxal phosphate-dependent aminotransferase n=1 Tax=Pendulispora albinea TaxID=2741071 RepID=A0ABZ2LPV2_9BACT